MKRVLAVILMCVMAFTFIGCGNKGDVVADGVVAGDSDAINKYISKVENAPEFETAVQQAKDAGMEIKIFAEGNNYVQQFTYIVDIPADAAAMLESSLQANSAQLTDVANTMRKEEPSINKVIWRYVSKDGVVLAEIEK